MAFWLNDLSNNLPITKKEMKNAAYDTKSIITFNVVRSNDPNYNINKNETIHHMLWFLSVVDVHDLF